ncbi:MAG: 3-dehydroquinate synthase [Campylobacteraceae bacterium]
MKIDIDIVPQKSQNYSIFIDELKELTLNAKVAIITNPTVASFHLEDVKSKIVARELHVVTIPDGEEYKNLETIEMILNELFTCRLDRKSVLIALGGGVIGDMTGFVASIYQRGIDFIQIPTTLLAQVDASVGGKTGVNNSFGKNLIGSFYQPIAVYCESRYLKTLPKREFSAGIAEIIKMAVTFDREFFTWLESADFKNDDDLRYAIKKCVEIKARVVSLDEKEQGIRAVLNYGHTFGHVIEHEMGYGTYLHGEAVSMGIVMANELALKLGFIKKDDAKRVEDLLKKHDLPTRYKLKNVDKFYDEFFLDKKSSNAKITFILPNSIGNYVMKNDIDEKLVKETLRTFL